MVVDYINYFRSLSIRHPDIKHSQEFEGLNGQPALCRFGKFWEPDLYAKTPPEGVISPGPTLMLHLAEGRPDASSGLYHIEGAFTGGFVISQRAIKGDVKDEEACFDQCFEILLDFLAEMRSQTLEQCGGFARFNFDNISFLQIGPIWDNRFGWWLRFDFNKPLGLESRPNVFE